MMAKRHWLFCVCFVGLCMMANCMRNPDITGLRCQQDADCGKFRDFRCFASLCLARCIAQGDCRTGETCHNGACQVSKGPFEPTGLLSEPGPIDEVPQEVESREYAFDAGEGTEPPDVPGAPDTPDVTDVKDAPQPEVSEPVADAGPDIDAKPETIPDEGARRNCPVGANYPPDSPCKFGVQTFSNGVWGLCLNGISPKKEICNGIDDDCDGINDNVKDGGPCD